MKMLERFLDYMKYSKCSSILTVNGYRKCLIRFEAFLNDRGMSIDKPEEIKLTDILDFTAYLRKSGLCEKSCNSFIDAIRSLLYYMENILDLNVLDRRRIRYIKTPGKEIGFFDDGQKQEIIKVVKRGVGVKKTTKLRNRLLTYMLLHTGLRSHEIAKIKVNEIGENLNILGKGKKLRTVYLRKELLDMIKEYLSKRKKNSEYLFEGNKDGHLKEGSIRNIYNEISTRTGFRVHAHKFRHTFATNLLNVPGSNIFNVAKLLGHGDIRTTQKYLGANDTELKNLQFNLQF